MGPPSNESPLHGDIDNIHASWIGNSLSAPQSINVFVLSLCVFRAYDFD